MDLSPPTTITACHFQLIVSLRDLLSRKQRPQVTINLLLSLLSSILSYFVFVLNLATVMRKITARTKSQWSARVLGSNWEPRMKKRRVSKRIANNFTVLVVKQLAFALRAKCERKKGNLPHLMLLTPYRVCAMP